MNAAKAACFSGRRGFMLKIIASVWCLAVLIITTYYTADFTSFITVPSYKPLIKSIYELHERRDLDVITDKGTNADAVIMVNLLSILYYSKLRLISILINRLQKMVF